MPATGTCKLTLEIEGDGVYRVVRLQPTSAEAKAVGLRASDGRTYRVSEWTTGILHCTCPPAKHLRPGGCNHALALVAWGLIGSEF